MDKAPGDYYTEYYAERGAQRNDLLSNPEVLFQDFATTGANIKALRRAALDRSSARILDVGCGGGASLFQLVRLGFRAENLAGVDVSEERLRDARNFLPAAEFRCESAEALSFEDESFDLALESTLFGTLDSMSLLASIAREMIRVTKPGGYIMLADWRYSRRGSGVNTAISKATVKRLFRVGESTDVIARERGALVPPLGRLLSHRAPAAYFLLQAVLPFAAGQITTLLKRR